MQPWPGAPPPQSQCVEYCSTLRFSVHTQLKRVKSSSGVFAYGTQPTPPHSPWWPGGKSWTEDRGRTGPGYVCRAVNGVRMEGRRRWGPSLAVPCCLSTRTLSWCGRACARRRTCFAMLWSRRRSRQKEARRKGTQNGAALDSTTARWQEEEKKKKRRPPASLHPALSIQTRNVLARFARYVVLHLHAFGHHTDVLLGVKEKERERERDVRRDE